MTHRHASRPVTLARIKTAKVGNAVQELRVVTDLLKTAEDDKAKLEQAVTAGHRSGEGVESVIAHLQIAPKAHRPDVL